MFGQSLFKSYGAFHSFFNIIYINLLSLCVCDGGFEGWGKEEAGETVGENSGRVYL